MDRVQVVGLVERVAAFDASCVDRASICAAAADIARLRSWLAARDAAVCAALAQVASFPEKTLADTVRVPLRDAGRSIERAALLAVAPVLAASLAAGRIDVGHVDALHRGLRGLDADQRTAVLAETPRLLRVAETVDADEFARTVRSEVERVRAENGIARLERQRRDARVRTWTDRATGMWCLSGRFDPETALVVDAQLRAVKERLFRDRVPQTAPEHPIERDHHLNALALAALITGTQHPRAGRAEIIPVLDLTAPLRADGPVVDWGLPVELPTEVLQRLLPDALIAPVVLANGVVVHAPGRLDLGRLTRLANASQRRVLRGLYPTCAIPGCGTRYDLCKIHHIHWWRHGGTTDLNNLLPVCVKHHTAIHQQNWRVQLAPDRTLTVDLPDGTRLTGTPARRRAPPTAA